MKKQYLLICGLCWFTLSLMAQNAPKNPPKTGYGIMFGTHLAVVNPESTTFAFGGSAGFFRFQDLSPQTRLIVEAQAKFVAGYNESTFFEDHEVQPDGYGKSTAKFELQSMLYVELPVLLQFRSSNTAKHGFLVGVRPSANLLVVSDQGPFMTSSVNNVYAQDYSQLSLREAVRIFDFGVSLGWTYALSERLGMSLRYTQGLFDLTADNFFKKEANTFNSDLQLGLHINF